MIVDQFVPQCSTFSSCFVNNRDLSPSPSHCCWQSPRQEFPGETGRPPRLNGGLQGMEWKLCLALRQINLVFEVNKALCNLQPLQSSVSLHLTERFKMLDLTLIASPVSPLLLSASAAPPLTPTPKYHAEFSVCSHLASFPLWELASAWFPSPPLQRSSFPNLSGNFVTCIYFNSHNRKNIQI